MEAEARKAARLTPMDTSEVGSSSTSKRTAPAVVDAVPDAKRVPPGYPHWCTPRDVMHVPSSFPHPAPTRQPSPCARMTGSPQPQTP
eukprot:1065463-Prymnesium_polylepis.1